MISTPDVLARLQSAPTSALTERAILKLKSPDMLRIGTGPKRTLTVAEALEFWNIRFRSISRTGQPINGLVEFLNLLKTCDPDTILDSIVFSNESNLITLFFVDSTGEFFGLLLVDSAEAL